MATKDIVYCDHCGKQMTVFDADGDAIHHGLSITKGFNVRENLRTSSGSSHRNVFEMTGVDFCSFTCLSSRMSKLSAELELGVERELGETS